MIIIKRGILTNVSLGFIDGAEFVKNKVNGN
jgi:hypothetical protein